MPIKRTKLTELETIFETFNIGESESIEDMYNWILQMKNEFIELGEPIYNNKVVGKVLCVMLRNQDGSQW